MPFSFGGALILKWQQLGGALVRGEGVGRAFLKMQWGVGLPFFLGSIIWQTSIRERPWGMQSLNYEGSAEPAGPVFQTSFSGCKISRGWGQIWVGALWLGSGEGGAACGWRWQQAVRSPAAMLQPGPSRGNRSVTLWGRHYFLCLSPCDELIFHTFTGRGFFFLFWIQLAPTYVDPGTLN